MSSKKAATLLTVAAARYYLLNKSRISYYPSGYFFPIFSLTFFYLEEFQLSVGILQYLVSILFLLIVYSSSIDYPFPSMSSLADYSQGIPSQNPLWD